MHTVVESEADLDDEVSPASGVLPAVIEFLDYFDESLDVVVSCARKTEMARWKRLFDIVGNPKTLFEVRCSPSVSLEYLISFRRLLCRLVSQ